MKGFIQVPRRRLLLLATEQRQPQPGFMPPHRRIKMGNAPSRLSRLAACDGGTLNQGGTLEAEDNKLAEAIAVIGLTRRH